MTTAGEGAVPESIDRGSRPRVIVETESLHKPGSDRGLGTYTTLTLQGYSDAGIALQTCYSRNAIDRERKLGKGRLRSLPYHSTSVYGLPVLKNRPWICSIQDVIPLDLDAYSKLGVKSRLAFLNAKRADLVIANSCYTANRILARIGRQIDEPCIVPLPLRSNFLEARRVPSDIRGEYVVAMVDYRTADPRKRTHWLGPIAAKLRQIGLTLKITGRGLDQASLELPDAQPVICSSDRDLIDLLSRARAFVYTSAYEGQGLPPLEAMACGTPVIAFRNSSITEMVGPGGGYLVTDPVPWELQKLTQQVPPKAVDEIVDIISMLIPGSADWNTCSVQGQRWAHTFNRTTFSRKLAHAVEALV